MDSEITIGIPGTWENRTKFIESVVVSTAGDFMFAAGLLAHPKGNDHVELEFYDADEQMAEAFAHAGEGKLSNTILDQIARHRSIVYLHFPFDIVSISLQKAG